MKKRKLNSKNSKYMTKEENTIKVNRKLICEAPSRTIKGKITSNSAKVKVYELRYE
tara:strand:+ start:2026 stop:2193 length:168 start_codon:yes stop_codon:yes gene_type:complete